MPRSLPELEERLKVYVSRWGQQALAEAYGLLVPEGATVRHRSRPLLDAINEHLRLKLLPPISEAELEGAPPSVLIRDDDPERAWLREKLRSPERITLRAFAAYARRHGVDDVGDVTWPLVADFLDGLEGRKGERLARSTANRKQGYLRSFFRAQWVEGVIVDNPVPKPPEDVRLPRAPTLEEFCRIRLAIAEARTFAENIVRNLLLVDLPATTGLRLAEIVNLRRSDILSAPVPLLHVRRGKGGQERYQATPEDVRDRLLAYAADLGPEDFVFSRDGTSPLSPDAVEDMFDRARARAGIPKSAPGRGDLTYHSLRHLYGTAVASIARNPEMTRQLLGHKTLAATAVYTEYRMEDKMVHVNALMKELRRHSAVGRVVGPVRITKEE
jgi:integrase